MGLFLRLFFRHTRITHTCTPLTPHPSPLTSQQGFTLVELLIVTVVIVALMGIMFRLTGIVGSTSERERTIARMQRLENCLSGYYAAFGQYPPVPLQGASYNIFRRVCDLHGIQYGEENDSELDQNAVRAACRAQPVAALYPPTDDIYIPGESQPMRADELLRNYQQAVHDYLTTMRGSEAARKASAWSGNPISYQSLATANRADFEGTSDFTRFQLFRFGLMSFLLPRYRFMLESAKPDGPFYDAIDSCKQWTDFNILPARMDSGVSYESWGGASGSSSRFTDLLAGTAGRPDERKRWELDLIPSQAACARWMPNLDGIVSGPSNTFFGVMIAEDRENFGFSFNFDSASQVQAPFSTGGHGGTCGSSSPYILFGMTVKDGWRNDFYYYSPPPYQSYILWSSGNWNDLTFPPWIDMNEFKSKYSRFYNTAVSWAADDIIFMGTGEK